MENTGIMVFTGVYNEKTGEFVKMEDFELVKTKKRGRPSKDSAKYKQDDYNDYQKQYAKEYYKNNKEKMLGSMKEKVQCDHCGKIVSKTNMVPHKKTKSCKYHNLTQISDNVTYLKELGVTLTTHELSKEILNDDCVIPEKENIEE